eukprot:1154305-Pelagomonas_calceolata.AAC.3
MQSCLELLLGRLAKVLGQGVQWVGQGRRCEFYRETSKPRGSRPMTGASQQDLGSSRFHVFAICFIDCHGSLNASFHPYFNEFAKLGNDKVPGLAG